MRKEGKEGGRKKIARDGREEDNNKREIKKRGNVFNSLKLMNLAQL